MDQLKKATDALLGFFIQYPKTFFLLLWPPYILPLSESEGIRKYKTTPPSTYLVVSTFLLMILLRVSSGDLRSVGVELTTISVDQISIVAVLLLCAPVLFVSVLLSRVIQFGLQWIFETNRDYTQYLVMLAGVVCGNTMAAGWILVVLTSPIFARDNYGTVVIDTLNKTAPFLPQWFPPTLVTLVMIWALFHALCILVVDDLSLERVFFGAGVGAMIVSVVSLTAIHANRLSSISIGIDKVEISLRSTTEDVVTGDPKLKIVVVARNPTRENFLISPAAYLQIPIAGGDGSVKKVSVRPSLSVTSTGSSDVFVLSANDTGWMEIMFPVPNNELLSGKAADDTWELCFDYFSPLLGTARCVPYQLGKPVYKVQ